MNEHGQVRALVERAHDVTHNYVLSEDEAETAAYLDEWQRVCAAADALDARPQPTPDHDDALPAPPLSSKPVTIHVMDTGQGAPLWIDDAELDAARPQPTPITQEALRLAGWSVDADNKETWYAHLPIGKMEITVVSIEGSRPWTTLVSLHANHSLWHIHTMQQLSQLVELLTGQPTPGEGARE